MRENVTDGGVSGGTGSDGAVGTARERKRRGPPPRPLAERLWEKVRKLPGDGCWVFLGSHHSDGYGQIGKGGHCGRMIGAHRAAWILTYGPIPPGLEVCHRCDNPPCCRPDHLFLGTRSENMRDAAGKGRLSPARFGSKNGGERNGRAQLTRAKVEEIRARFGRETARELATAYGVSRYTIYAAVQGRSWAEDKAA